MSITPVQLLLYSFLFQCVMNILGGFGIAQREARWRRHYTYAHTYSRQNKFIIFLRKCFGMETKVYLHWMSCVLHYIEFVALLWPLLMLLVFLFVPTGGVVSMFSTLYFYVILFLWAVWEFSILLVQSSIYNKAEKEREKRSKK